MDSLLYLEALTTQEDPKPQPLLLSIPWDRLIDDTGEDEIGYSFVTELRNQQWLGELQDWVVQRILANPQLKGSWITSDSANIQFYPTIVADYLN